MFDIHCIYQDPEVDRSDRDVADSMMGELEALMTSAKSRYEPADFSILVISVHIWTLSIKL